ncbi:putative exocyst complex component [Phytophthora cinnamomi]|uniref:putative exocyst complex component n=1 Tax=Phytophthora cinnamomi TaxID=4785 RepID=UPI00355A0B74|nr:putative exocyst complex component [Phytophthora cinnamomi]
MTGRGDGNEAPSAWSWIMASDAHGPSVSGPSAELEKLLAAAADSGRSQASAYNAETMVDELLSSTWEPMDPTSDNSSKGSVVRHASFSQQTSSLNALQSVLTESIDRLVQHRKLVSNRIAELEQDSRRVSSKFQEGLVKPDLLLNDICAQMEDLEERFTKVSSSAVLIGDKLSGLDGERSRVLETDELMEALLALNDPSSKLTKSSNRLFNILHDPNQLHEASRIVKKMSVFSSELSSPEIAYAVAEIERLSQTTENELLNEFTSEQQKGNTAGMRNCAESLIEYNDKEKVADRYVWNVMCDRLAKAAEPAVSSLDPIEDLDALFTKILTICTEQFPVVDNVFPNIILKDSELRGELVTRIFTSFVTSFGDEYLSKITTLAREIIQDQRLIAPESALQYFIVTEALFKRIDFLDEQFEARIAPSQEDSPTQLTICQESKRKCLDKLERSIAASLQQALTVIEKTIGQILTVNQGKGDFLGGQASMSLSSSKACQKCTEYLQPLVQTLCRVLVEENCDRFLVALAQSFKELYLQHLRKFRFDPDGACMLLRDVSEYRQAFRSPSLPTAVDDIFDLLHEIANVFALPPENLGGFVREGKLATLNKQTLQHIVKRRWDYKTNAEKIAASLKDAKDEKST